jgi:nicotinate (nicotinamide) nucleotide adenylyltransferase
MKDAEKIVVMGGSFNPPTIAHYKLMKDAMQVVKADLGYFVPASDAYLKRKMRYNKSAIVLSPKVRIDMLQCMCADRTMKVSDIEMGTIKARSLETLMAIQEEYPAAQIYFIMGDDKMKLLVHLCKKKDFIENFKVILYSRNEASLISCLDGVNIPSDYLDNIIMCPQPEGISGVSSSLIRERLMSGESCDDLLYPGVVELLKDSAAFNRNVNKNYNIQKDMKYSVESIKQMVSADPNVRFIYFWGHTPSVKGITESCMSQWYDVEFEVAGVKYHTAEQYMMAQKALLFDDKQVFDQIMLADNPRDYKALGRKIRKFDSKIWDARKYDIVVEGNKAKFSQNDDLKEYLLSTGDAILVEASPYDRIWGIGLYPGQAAKGSIDQWRGLNLLGAALMEVRDWLREAL